MKYIFSVFFLFAQVLCHSAQADDKTDLKKVLDSFNAFSASFTQNVIKKDRTELASSKGTISLKKPDLLMMYTSEPDEQVLFTRDNKVYFYDPFINQVSIFNKSQMSNSPFILLTSNDALQWQNYEVNKQGDSYVLTPNIKGEIKSLSLDFAGDVLSKISIDMSDGNTNTYILSDQKKSADDAVFDYNIPSDAEVDDERLTK